jgi:site-specific DNA recombinase
LRNSRSGQAAVQPAAGAPVRCAIYTRKSTDEGLSQEFNSLDAQRESAEAYITSQRHEGWVALPAHYDDGGFTGGNLERPGLQRLLADIEVGEVDAVVVYKVDRLSRSLLDFARLMEVFEKHGVSFVSVTQSFNSTSSLGRLTLNILLSFAQFEREIIAERTRDKMSAARRKGKWTGGSPVLGYDVDPRGGRLMVNEGEAGRVRAIFDLYLEHRSVIAVVREVNNRGWTTKRWTTKDGREHPGRPMGKGDVYKILTNILYTGQVNHKGTIYPGEHAAIIDPAVFQEVNERLAENGTTGGKEIRNKYGALLRGLLHCDACGTAMHHTYTAKAGRRYRYYVCATAQQRGWDACPSRSLSAQQIEDSVVERVRELARNPQVVAETLRQAQEQSAAGDVELRAELQAGERELRRLNADLVKVAATAGNGVRLDRMADLQDRIGSLERRMSEVRAELGANEGEAVTEEEVMEALRTFDPVWKSLNTNEQTRIIRTLVERVGYDGRTGKVAVTFRSAGFRALCGGNREEQ